MTCLKPPSQQPRSNRTCLGATCMKWTPSGELSELDLHTILERLARVDPNLAGSEDAEGLLLAVPSSDVHPT
jgi:hypothetical protein